MSEEESDRWFSETSVSRSERRAILRQTLIGLREVLPESAESSSTFMIGVGLRLFRGDPVEICEAIKKMRHHRMEFDELQHCTKELQ